MRITKEIKVTVEVDLDVDGEDVADLDTALLEKQVARAAAECLHQNAGMGLVEDMVEYVTDETGFCIKGLVLSFPE